MSITYSLIKKSEFLNCEKKNVTFSVPRKTGKKFGAPFFL